MTAGKLPLQARKSKRLSKEGGSVAAFASRFINEMSQIVLENLTKVNQRCAWPPI